MTLVYTEQAIASLQECLNFLWQEQVSHEKIDEIRDRILAKADKLLNNPHLGQEEEYLEHVRLSHRRVIEGNYMIIYRLRDKLFLLPIFLTVAKIRLR